MRERGRFGGSADTIHYAYFAIIKKDLRAKGLLITKRLRASMAIAKNTTCATGSEQIRNSDSNE